MARRKAKRRISSTEQKAKDFAKMIKDDFEEDYKITKAEVNKLKQKFTEKTGLDPDEFWKVKE